MLAAYDAIQHIRRYHILTRSAFCGWLGHQARQRRKRQQVQRATTHRDLLRLQGKPLLFWLHWTRVERHAKVKLHKICCRGAFPSRCIALSSLSFCCCATTL